MVAFWVFNCFGLDSRPANDRFKTLQSFGKKRDLLRISGSHQKLDLGVQISGRLDLLLLLLPQGGDLVVATEALRLFEAFQLFGQLFSGFDFFVGWFGERLYKIEGMSALRVIR